MILLRRTNPNNLFKKKGELPGSVSTVGVFDANAYELHYSKGCFLLMELEDKIGVKKMDRFLQKRIKEKLNTTSAVLDALESVTDKTTRNEFQGKLTGNWLEQGQE